MFRRSIMKNRLAERVALVCGPSTFIGFLEEVGRDGYLLRAAVLHADGEERPVTVGEVLVPIGKVEFVQLMAGRSE